MALENLKLHYHIATEWLHKNDYHYRTVRNDFLWDVHAADSAKKEPKKETKPKRWKQKNFMLNNTKSGLTW